MERLPHDCGPHADRCRQLASHQNSDAGTDYCIYAHFMAEGGFKAVYLAQEQHFLVLLAPRILMCLCC